MLVNKVHSIWPCHIAAGCKATYLKTSSENKATPKKTIIKTATFAKIIASVAVKPLLYLIFNQIIAIFINISFFLKPMSLLNFYDKQYKKLLIIPIALLVLSIISLVVQTAQTGTFVNQGVSIAGGLTLTISGKTTSTIELQDLLKDKFPEADLTVRDLKTAGQKTGIIIDASGVESDQLIKAVEEKIGELEKEDYTIEEIGSALGQAFFKQTLTAILIAFLFMALVVFLYFRTLIPSLAVILSAVSDIIITLAIFNLFGFKLSAAGIAAFLMLIGYSVDTDILLSTRVIKRKEGTVFERVCSAAKTGLMMSATTVSALIIALIFAQSDVLRQIMIILLIGLFVDLISTWFQNAAIIRLYMEKKNKI